MANDALSQLSYLPPKHPSFSNGVGRLTGRVHAYWSRAEGAYINRCSPALSPPKIT